MNSTDTCIIKIQALADYYTTSPNYLSFKKGQQFYALSSDYQKGVFFARFIFFMINSINNNI
jgi:hypothetical protein